MKDSLFEWLSCLQNFIDLPNIDLNDEKNKQEIRSIIENMFNDLEELDE